MTNGKRVVADAQLRTGGAPFYCTFFDWVICNPNDPIVPGSRALVLSFVLKRPDYKVVRWYMDAVSNRYMQLAKLNGLGVMTMFQKKKKKFFFVFIFGTFIKWRKKKSARVTYSTDANERKKHPGIIMIIKKEEKEKKDKVFIDDATLDIVDTTLLTLGRSRSTRRRTLDVRSRRCAKGIKTRGTVAAADCWSTAATGAIAGRRVVAAVRERFVVAIRWMHASQSRRGSSRSKGHGSRVQVQVGAVRRVLHHLWCNDNMASSWRSTQVTSRSIRVGSRSLRLTRAIQMSKIASGGSSSSSTRYKASVRVLQATRLASEHDKEDSANEGQ